MLEFLFGFLGEFLVQVIGQLLIELALSAMLETFLESRKPALAAIGYLVFGAIVGLISLGLFPVYLFPTHILRIINLVITPIAVGMCMSAIGSWRAKRGQMVMRIDTFAYGYLFALGLALVRFYGAK